jgi:AcrR family transcriptional regulator
MVNEQPHGSSPLSIKDRILDTFENKSANAGFRSVTMGSLANELGVSTKTLYKTFFNKADLVYALVDKWTVRWEANQVEGMALGLPIYERTVRTVNLLIEMNEKLGQEAWRQLRNDYPEAYNLAESATNSFFENTRRNLDPEMRDDINKDLAFSVLKKMLTHAQNSKDFDRSNLTVVQAITEVLIIWGRGVIKPEGLPDDLK